MLLKLIFLTWRWTFWKWNCNVFITHETSLKWLMDVRFNLVMWGKWDVFTERDVSVQTDVWYSRWVWFLRLSCAGSVEPLPGFCHDSDHQPETQIHWDPTSLHTTHKTHVQRKGFFKLCLTIVHVTHEGNLSLFLFSTCCFFNNAASKRHEGEFSLWVRE